MSGYAESLVDIVGERQAKNVLHLYAEPRDLLKAEEEQLPCSPANRRKLAAAVRFARMASEPQAKPTMVRVSADVFEVCRNMKDLNHEEFRVLMLNTKHRLIGDVTIVKGGLTTCSVLPREVYAPAIIRGAPAVIFVHNHPSGDPCPSVEDLTLTARLKSAGSVLGIKVLDHVIVGDGRYVSLVDEGQFMAL